MEARSGNGKEKGKMAETKVGEKKVKTHPGNGAKEHQKWEGQEDTKEKYKKKKKPIDLRTRRKKVSRVCIADPNISQLPLLYFASSWGNAYHHILFTQFSLKSKWLPKKKKSICLLMSFPGYLPGFSAWWATVSDILSGEGSVASLWETPFEFTITLMFATTLFTFIASAINNNDSWVDRLWSISPVLYAWILAEPLSAGFHCCSTASLFSCLITLWGARLTYNFYRKGGYNRGGEDYRWNYVRSWAIFRGNRPLWLFFSFTIVSLYQCLLLWAIAVPVAVLPKSTAATRADYVLALVFLVFLGLETLADQQQWEFQNQKYKTAGFPREKGLEADYKNGFLTHGVFSFSRHLNVWSEQSMWVVVSLVAATHHAPAELAIGCVTLVALTVGSTTLTEGLSAGKYPKYAAYQKATPMLIPSMMSTRPQIDRALRGD